MTQTDGRKENQHSVPKMLLRNFAITPGADTAKVHVLDKSNSRTFVSNIRNVAAAFDFYVTEMAGRVVNAERVLSELEGRAAGVMSKMMANRSITCLTPEDREWWAIFCAVQFMRTQTVRDRFTAIHVGMEAHIRRMGFDPNQVMGFKPATPEMIKAMTIQMLGRAINEFPAILMRKKWFLMEATSGGSFLISDHPVVLHNDKTFGPYGNLGLAVPGIQIYLPLSPRLTFAMWCPSLLMEIEAGWKEPRKNLAKLKQPHIRQRLTNAQLTEIDALEQAMGVATQIASIAEKGDCLTSNADNTTMLNSRQIGEASRFIMSNKHDFELAEKMFADDPRYRSPGGEGFRVG